MRKEDVMTSERAEKADGQDNRKRKEAVCRRVITVAPASRPPPDRVQRILQSANTVGPRAARSTEDLATCP